MVPRAGIEPATQRFSVSRSTIWATEAHYNKAHFFIDQRRIAPPRSAPYGFAVCAFYKMHLNSYGEFHSATSCPESKRSLAEPMRAIWLSASFINYKIRLSDCFHNRHAELLDQRLPAYDRVRDLRSHHVSLIFPLLFVSFLVKHLNRLHLPLGCWYPYTRRALQLDVLKSLGYESL